MLRVEKVTKTFGGLHAVREASLEVVPGRITAVIGPNGAGKSTLMNLISGFAGASSGTVSVAGDDITQCKPHQICQRGIARTFQNLQMFSDMTVLEVVVTGRSRHRRASLLASLLMTPLVRREEREARAHAAMLLEKVAIGRDYWERRAGDLPYGLQRRVEIARALATEPAYLLLDEPAAGLNDEESAALGVTLRALAEEGIGIALIEHDIDLVMDVSHQVFVMDAGAVIASGTPDKVRADPRVVQAYLGEDHGE
jgi:ABC-type branched-subunit amino acid transport system ATPase component